MIQDEESVSVIFKTFASSPVCVTSLGISTGLKVMCFPVILPVYTFSIVI